MDNPATESIATPEQPSLKDRLAAHLKAEFGDRFEYESPTAEPEGQPQAEANVETQPEPAPETQTEEAQAEPEGQPDEVTEAVEYEGKEYRVPKELKEALLRQADYTRKTMEVAEERKAVQQERQTIDGVKQALAQVAPLIAQLGVIDAHAQALQRVDMQALREVNPQEWVARNQEWQNLMGQRNQLMQVLGQVDNYVKAADEARFKQEVERNVPLVEKHIPGFGHDRARALTDFLRSGPLPFSDDRLKISDAATLYHLNRSFELSKVEAERAKTAQKVSMAPPVNRSTQRAPVSSAEIEHKKALSQLAKSGESDDVMAVLAARRKLRR